ncbi:hypothetical protein D3C81_237560 [compost metagenome]
MSNVFDLFQNTGSRNKLGVGPLIDYTPQHTAEVVERARKWFDERSAVTPLNGEEFLRLVRQQQREPGQVMLVVDSYSPMHTS